MLAPNFTCPITTMIDDDGDDDEYRIKEQFR